MPRITLTAVTRTQGCTQALKEGAVTTGDFGLRFEEVPVLIQAFRRMVRCLEFDVSEMAFSTYLCAKAHGKPVTALPVFLVRGFHHSAIIRSAASNIGHPRELEGRRVGVNRGYTVTTGVWARGILADEYGVDLGRVTWVRSGDEHVAEYQPPPNVVSMQGGRDLAELVAAGDLAAAVGITADRPDLVPLIPDARKAGFAALRQRGLYPINHLVVVRDELLSSHPGLAVQLFDAYAEAKNRYVARLREWDIPNPTPADRMYRRVMEATGADPLPYGIGPNLPMIELLIRHAISQKILDKRVSAEELFARSTQGLAA